MLLDKDPSLADQEELLKLVKQSSQRRTVHMTLADRQVDDAPGKQPLSTFLPTIGLGNRIDDFCAFQTLRHEIPFFVMPPVTESGRILRAP